jgi:acyl-coenzyme A thioesterase PaaI-like protein
MNLIPSVIISELNDSIKSKEITGFYLPRGNIHKRAHRKDHSNMPEKAFQDFYTEETSYCYGCGRLNEHGLQIKSYWDGEESVCVYEPRPYHIAIPGYVYGGLIASLIDCHSTGTAAAASYRAQERTMETLPPLRFVTASLHVDYLKPTPLGVPLEVRGRVIEVKGRKVVVESTLSAEGSLCARGQVVAVQAPDSLFSK